MLFLRATYHGICCGNPVCPFVTLVIYQAPLSMSLSDFQGHCATMITPVILSLDLGLIVLLQTEFYGLVLELLHLWSWS